MIVGLILSLVSGYDSPVHYSIKVLDLPDTSEVRIDEHGRVAFLINGGHGAIVKFDTGHGIRRFVVRPPKMDPAPKSYYLYAFRHGVLTGTCQAVQDGAYIMDFKQAWVYRKGAIEFPSAELPNTEGKYIDAGGKVYGTAAYTPDAHGATHPSTVVLDGARFRDLQLPGELMAGNSKGDLVANFRKDEEDPNGGRTTPLSFRHGKLTELTSPKDEFGTALGINDRGEIVGTIGEWLVRRRVDGQTEKLWKGSSDDWVTAAHVDNQSRLYYTNGLRSYLWRSGRPRELSQYVNSPVQLGEILDMNPRGQLVVRAERARKTIIVLLSPR